MNLKSLGRLPSIFVYHKMEIEAVYLVLSFLQNWKKRVADQRFFSIDTSVVFAMPQKVFQILQQAVKNYLLRYDPGGNYT